MINKNTKENKIDIFNIEEISEDYKQLVSDNKISELLEKIETNSNDEILKIIAFKTADQHDKARRLIDFLRSEIDIRRINSNNKLNKSICLATWIIAISTVFSLFIK